MFYLHHKKQQIGYNTACRFCGDRLPQNHKQYREICHESETKPGDGLYVLEPENDINEQGDREKHVKTGRLPMQPGELEGMHLVNQLIKRKVCHLDFVQ